MTFINVLGFGWLMPEDFGFWILKNAVTGPSMLTLRMKK